MKKRALISTAIVGGAVAAVAIAERLFPLRSRREPQLRHVGRDAAFAAMSIAATSAAQILVLRRITTRLESDRFGLVGSARRLSRMGRIIASVLALDYTLWVWHWMNHRMPVLWHFHRVHHADLDLDSATGARFHFGEMSLSVLFRWLQLRVIGPDPIALSIWQTMLLSSIFFHHSNTRLPLRAERDVAAIFVTPRMHGIHHSIVEDEMNTNFASLFTWWDMLHGRFVLDDRPVTIGIAELQDPRDVTLAKMLY